MPSNPSAGVSAAASFELQGFAPQLPPTPILADAIDARSRDVVSLTRGATIADGMVSYLIGLKRGSGAAIRSFGQRFAEVSHVEEDSELTIASLAREALQPAVDSGVVRIENIELAVQAGDGTQIDGTITYRNLLATGDAQDETLSLKPPR